MTEWFISLVTLIVPWIVWIFIHKKESTGRLLLVCFFVISISTLCDMGGVILGLWSYNILVQHNLNVYIPWTFSLFPVTIMLLIQYMPNTSPYIKALIYSVILVFIIEPIFAWFGIFNPINWEYIYGLPFFYVYYLLAHKLSRVKSFAELTERKEEIK